MNTPIFDFVNSYNSSGSARLHMPGHKGKGPLGIEQLDLTEICGADDLYHPEGIIKQSEENAAMLFNSGATFYSTEGSSQCVKAMLLLARGLCKSSLVLAARNAHKSFVHACALLDLSVEWLFESESTSLCSCKIEPSDLEERLNSLNEAPLAVYITSPDYLGNIADIEGLAEVCHRHKTLLIVDNAHGAYFHFLKESRHPLSLGADLCCDSAHKTLPVLTGGAYLHISKALAPSLAPKAKQALSIFGSTSPSYLTLASLDLCNSYLEDGYKARLGERIKKIDELKEQLKKNGWAVKPSDPLRLTLLVPDTLSGYEIQKRLSQSGIEIEYADEDFLVFMFTPENTDEELLRLEKALGKNSKGQKKKEPLPSIKAKQALSIRNATLAPSEKISADDAVGRICGTPTVCCPPAIAIAVSGEVISENHVILFKKYGINSLDVVIFSN